MIENSIKRFNHNVYMFIIAYGLIGIITGIVFDVLVTYLEVALPNTAKSFAAFMGLATFLGAFLILFSNKFGYKKIMITGPLASIFGLTLVNLTTNPLLTSISIVSILTGVTLFDVILPPFLSLYTTSQNRAKLFSKALYINVGGTVLGTFIGGPLIVWRFSKKLNILYNQSKLLTENIKNFNALEYTYYIDAHKQILTVFILLLVFILVPLLLIKERKEDYWVIQKKESKKIISLDIFSNRYAIVFLLYTILCKFAASLIAPYVPIYLSKIGIDRAIISTLGTLQYFATFSFMIISPYIIKKVGQVKTLGWLCLASVPFMLILSGGNHYGNNTIIIVGSALFFRSGFINATNPVVNSLPMEIVTKELRPMFTALIFVVQGLAQTASGIFTKGFLFKNDRGYLMAYNISAILFTLAHIILLIVFTKNFNRNEQSLS